MATLHFERREVEAKVVYCGPALSGKTTNLRVLHRLVPSGQRGDLHELATDQDRTLFFDFIPVELGEIGEYAARFKLYSVPGQVYYRETRRVVLQGADAVVFVADSSPDRLQANLDALADLAEAMAELGLDRAGVPVIFQLNKRDVEGALPVDQLLAELKIDGAARVEAVASEGRGVLNTLHAACELASERIRRRLSGDASAGLLERAAEDAPEGELEEVDRVLERVLEVRPRELAEAERRKAAERARPDDVDGFFMEYVDRSADADLGVTDPGVEPEVEEEPEFAAARPGAGRRGESVAARVAPAGEVGPLPPRAPADPAAAPGEAPRRAEVPPVSPAAEEPDLERTVPQVQPPVPAGPALDARVDPDAFDGAAVREVLGFRVGADGLPEIELVLERDGQRRRHPLRFRRQAPPAAVSPGGLPAAAMGLGFGALGMVLGLGLGWWLFG